MSTIFFRTNAGRNDGLGHLVRSCHLAKELQANGAHCVFILDYIEEGIAPFLSGIEYHSLYDSIQDTLDAENDAKKFLKLCANQAVDWVILDSYRLSKHWENCIQKNGIKLCIIDDLLRSHTCDMLIDMRWHGKNTYLNYDEKTPNHCAKLLGPSYAILSSNCKIQHLEKKNRDAFTLMISLGGGGDLNICKNMINGLLASNTALHIFVTLGPLSPNIDIFLKYYENVENVECLFGKTELHSYLIQTDFYIGASGGTIYQLRCLNIPALLFSIAENQENDHSLLEDIGQFFYLNNWGTNELQQLPIFIKTVQDHFTRIKEIGKKPKIQIDGFGTERIAKAILGPNNATISLISNEDNKHGIKLSIEHNLRPVIDQDINHYLASRNLDANCQNMIEVSKIPYLNHYSWWFNAKRSSYLLTKLNIPSLYIWHEVIDDFLIGGWFVCDDQTGFQDALLALNWQIEHCDKEYPNLTWVAVINRQNKYVKLLNDYIGFEEIQTEHPSFAKVSHIFNNADPKGFHYVIRKPILHALSQETKRP